MFRSIDNILNEHKEDSDQDNSTEESDEVKILLIQTLQKRKIVLNGKISLNLQKYLKEYNLEVVITLKVPKIKMKHVCYSSSYSNIGALDFYFLILSRNLSLYLNILQQLLNSPCMLHQFMIAFAYVTLH